MVMMENIMANTLRKDFKRNWILHLMLFFPLVILFIYAYFPLFGLSIAFQRFIPSKGIFGKQTWVGWKNFQFLFKMPEFKDALRNTFTIAFFKLTFTMLTSIFFAILINEVRNRYVKRVVQTIVYLPHFISWVILATVFIDIFSPSEGIVNQMIEFFGGESIFFLGSNKWFQPTMIITDIWKEFGFGTIVYLAAITSIDPGLYEAAIVDGANKFQQIWHITIPGMLGIITLMALLNIGGILNGNFDQIYNMYSPQVYRTGDILDTLVYRVGLVDYNFSLATAVGLFRSTISLVLISLAYYSAYKITDYRIF
jgi:putative aldouronate transport system permease protein